MKTIILTSITTLALALGAHAQRAGLNITDGWPAPMIGGYTVDGCANWTDSMADMGGGGTNPQFGTLALTGTPITAVWNSANTWAAGAEGTKDQGLYRVYLDDGDGGSSLVGGDGIGVSVTLTGLGAWLAANGATSYQIRCYGSTDTDNASFQPVLIRAGAPNAADGANQLLNLTVLDTVNRLIIGPGDYPPNTTPDPTWGMWQPRGYGDSIAGLTDDVVTLTIASRDGSTRGTLAGFQLIAVPEPSSFAVLGLGLAALACRRARRA
jgi:hypothetical protein